MTKRCRTVIALVMLISVSFLTGGCASPFSQIGDLLHPPVYSEEDKELRDAFVADVGSEFYKSPISGEYLSAYVVHDLNSDKNDEAFVFFADDQFGKTVSVAVYGKTDGVWKQKDLFSGDGNDVYSVEFFDFNGDSVEEIIICWSLFDSKSNKLVAVYSVNDELKLTKLSTEMYTIKELADVDGDGISEMFLVHLDATSGKQEASAKLLRMDKNAFSMVDKRSLDGNVSGYKGICTERDEKANTFTFFIDAYKGENQMITEAVIWNGETSSLSVPLLDSETRTNTESWRSVRLGCTDVNGDGKIEMPSQEPFEAGEIWMDGAVLPTVPYITEWFVIEKDKPITVERSIVNVEQQCIFKIPKGWEKKFSVSMFTDENRWDFYQMNPYSKEKIQYLFSVMFLTVKEWETEGTNKYENYVLLDEKDEKCLVVSGINTENELNVSFDKLSEAFSYLSL